MSFLSGVLGNKAADSFVDQAVDKAEPPSEMMLLHDSGLSFLVKKPSKMVADDAVAPLPAPLIIARAQACLSEPFHFRHQYNVIAAGPSSQHLDQSPLTNSLECRTTVGDSFH
ncbi:hypothetical protein DNTS_002674 [Danionella cerebrum]|uniref:Uncharacterized protein n=1 Tax=Danionella cerebrum TaxID=2873325 RepID=A0A553QKN5_9TELE|nr:hypothetical protein DNTS_002674 [Danionella translucida]